MILLILAPITWTIRKVRAWSQLALLLAVGVAFVAVAQSYLAADHGPAAGPCPIAGCDCRSR